jgi:hypothetical protein
VLLIYLFHENAKADQIGNSARQGRWGRKIACLSPSLFLSWRRYGEETQKQDKLKVLRIKGLKKTSSSLGKSIAFYQDSHKWGKIGVSTTTPTHRNSRS